MRFELTAEEIAEALAEESVEVAAPEDIPVPDALLPAEEVEALVARAPPRLRARRRQPRGAQRRVPLCVLPSFCCRQGIGIRLSRHRSS